MNKNIHLKSLQRNICVIKNHSVQNITDLINLNHLIQVITKYVYISFSSNHCKEICIIIIF